MFYHLNCNGHADFFDYSKNVTFFCWCVGSNYEVWTAEIVEVQGMVVDESTQYP